MEPPTEQIFDSRELLIDSVRQHALSQGYAISITGANANRNVSLGCDRGGKYHDRINAPEGAKRRLTTTRRIGCPFKLYGKKILNSEKWELKVRHPSHNHPADNSMIGHPSARKLTEEQLRNVHHMSEVGSKPREILTLIKRENSDALVTPRDIYNARSALRRQKLGNSTPIELLQKTLQENYWKYAIKQDHEGHILFFMFAHPKSIEYANKYNRVFVLDCTYKTNRYKMPLLHIIGVSPSNSTFSIAFCFMQNEQEESYIWALKAFFSFLNPLPFEPVLCTDRDLALLGAIKDVCPRYPHLLCVWHINKNVTQYTKQYFSTNDEHQKFLQSWNQLIYSTTEDIYNSRLLEFKKQFPLPPIRYIEETWLIHKEKFIVAWIQQYLHLGNAATSRVEGSHAFLKKYLGSSTGDMLFVFEGISQALQAQHGILAYDFAGDQIQRVIVPSKELYTNIMLRTSRFSIRRISEQVSKAKRATEIAPLRPCQNGFTRTMGLPCAHRIFDLLKRNQAIPLTDIHPFWRIGFSESESEYLPLLEPLIPLPKPKKRKRDEAQAVENIEGEPNQKKKKAPPKCSICGIVGHTRRSCK
jgi:MULE transposase domain